MPEPSRSAARAAWRLPAPAAHVRRGSFFWGGPISRPGGASWPACPLCPLFSFYLRLFFLPPVCFSDFARHTFSLVCPFPVSRPLCRGVCTVSLGTFSRPPAHSSLICSSPSVPAAPWTTSCANLTFLPALFAPDRERLSSDLPVVGSCIGRSLGATGPRGSALGKH